MPHVSLFRLYSLRAVYLIIALGLALVVWPGVLRHAEPWGLAQGVVKCMLTAFSLLCIVGIRYPLQMLPVLKRGDRWGRADATPAMMAQE